MTIQSQIDAAAASGGGDVVFPAALYTLTTQIVVKSGVRLIGSGKVTYDYHRPFAVPPLSGAVNGTLFDVRWGSGAGTSGNPAYAAVLMQAGSTIQNIGFTYPQDMFAAAPVEWGSTVQVYDPQRNAYGITIRDLYGYMPYIFIDCRAHSTGSEGLSNLVVSDIQGCPLYTGFAMDGQTDWGSVRYCNFNIGFIKDGLRTGLVAWTAANGIAFQLDGNDWAMLQQPQAFGYGRGLRIRGGVGGYPTQQGPYTIINPQFDACWHGVDVEGPTEFTVKVVDGVFVPYNFITGAGGAALGAIGSNIKSVMFKDNDIFGPALFGAYCDGVRDVQISGNRATSSSGAWAWLGMNGDRVNISDNRMIGFSGNVATDGSVNVVNQNNQ